ncbi:MAG: histidine kinase [Bacteroidetes bacterium GWF2_38_335]|nr:MAG: histidine kinase [Bacteroidetes bacterium GWF2_38_335]OFY79518.1 MAG: histidine kinase [Bacteroidetes bacterium RIFOXYA12_FULL_38_20]HBS86543.1 ATP-binding protein [Bacteroidales bacterium]
MKNFNFHIILRIVLLILTIGALFLVICNYYFPILTFTLSAIIVFETWELIRYINRVNENLKNFLESIRYSEFSRTFESKDTTSFGKLNIVFNNVISDFQKIRKEKEEQYYFLDNVIQHIGISLIAFDESGTVSMVNNAAKKLFQVNDLKNIEELNLKYPQVFELLKKLANGEKTLIKVQEENDLLQLSIYAKEFKISDKLVTLVSIQNIQYELEDKEMEAWQKLIRVLTHEIMNSITPIASLTATAGELLRDSREKLRTNDCEGLGETFEDIEGALMTISKRSSGLQHFVETYQNLTRIPKPNFSTFKIADLLIDIHRLYKSEFEEHKIDFSISVFPENLELSADEELIGQVVINLVKNSVQALNGSESKKIELISRIDRRGGVTIEVHDNGQGILPEVIDRVFIPFFSTKQNGSGIGLSLSRQIMRLHGGTITAISEPGVKTSFILKF